MSAFHLVMRQRIFYGISALALFAIEACIALFAHGFVRNALGDILVVILIHCALRIIFPLQTGKGHSEATEPRRRWLPFYVFLFACAIELGQFLRLFDTLPHTLRIVLGGTFDWGDILCYFVGAAIAMLMESFYYAY